MQEINSSISSQNSNFNQLMRIRNYAWYFVAIWTLLLIVSAALTVREDKKTLVKLASTGARAAISRDILYRHWGASHGGVYAPVTEKTPPNPYLSHIPERDIVTPSGRKLTLINPAYMTRQVYEQAGEIDPTIGKGHLTSLKPIRPENAPDEWERKSLESFEKGVQETSEMLTIDNKPFIRLMRAFITEKACLKCHADQGYKEGDVRGGLSVKIPIQTLNDATSRHIFASLLIHGFVWIMGLIITAFGTRQLIRSAKAQRLVEMDLQDQAIKMEEEIAERQAAQESLEETENRLQEQNYELQVTEEMLRVQLGEYEISQTNLKELNSNLKAIFEVSPMPIIISSHDSCIVREINQTFSDVFGYQRDVVIGKSGFDLGIWSDISELNDFIRTVDERDRISGFPAKILNIRGEVRIIIMYSTKIDFKNEPCFLILFMDVTEQKRTEDELRQAQKMDVVGQLAGGVAHDFNNMLTAIIGSADMMERYVKDNPAQIKLLKTIQEAAGRSADLTRRLLAFSHKGSKSTTHVWINKTVQTVIDMLEHSIDKNIKLESRLTAVNDLVIGDPTQLQSALLNLGINARDAMPNGGIITYTTAQMFLDETYCGIHGHHMQPGQYLEISVSDTGVGIKKDVIEHIFEPFFTTKELGKGTGLGLAAVYDTVKYHKGCVSVYSEPDIGTIFKLYLPIANEQNENNIQENEFSQGSGGILLVDDEPLVRDMGQALLEDHGYRVFLAENGQQALEVYERESEHIKLVILDIVMPVMGGKEALQRLIALYPNVRVLISSGFHQDESNDIFIKLGAKGFIQKPYRVQELFKTVGQAIVDSK